eukprot:CAMPEP_0115862640 /NCGR_PEP_ID=MMETSP0287-20121206/18281_1 /TAXON_ID=412157 /ORGANISM="Chrysochromulina rotalis, Strain UIO044" /LENGTH=79 /DNA_ID=CAMNT_0003317069 /DNA_START=471 /DNA_END=707 /DNA_ORIENTATION=-
MLSHCAAAHLAVRATLHVVPPADASPPVASHAVNATRCHWEVARSLRGHCAAPLPHEGEGEAPRAILPLMCFCTMAAAW